MSSQTIITLTGDEKSAYDAFKRIIEQEAKTVAKTKELGDAAKKAGTDLAGMKLKPIDTKTVKQAKKDADALTAAVDKVKASGRGGWFNVDNAPLLESVSIMGTVGVALATASKAWTLYKEKMKEALDSQKENQPGDQRLIQVSANEADARNLIQRADDAALATGVPRNTARNILFTARSENFEPAYEAIMASSRVVAPEAQAIVAGKLPTIFNQTIKPIEAVSMTLRAAQASNLSFEQLGSVAPSASEGAALLGATPEETMGVLSVLSSRFKSPETAADRIKAFSAGLGIDPQFKDLGIVGAFQKLQAMPEEERTKILGGSQEMNVGFKLIGDALPDIQTRIDELREERRDYQAGGGMLRRQNEIAMRIPSIVQQSELDKARVRKEVETERRLSTAATSTEVSDLQSESLAERKGASMLNRLFTSGANMALTPMLPQGIPTEGRALLSNMIGDAVESQILGPTSLLQKRSTDSGLVVAELSRERISLQDSIERSFNSELPVPGQQPPPIRQPQDAAANSPRPQPLREVAPPAAFAPLARQPLPPLGPNGNGTNRLTLPQTVNTVDPSNMALSDIRTEAANARQIVNRSFLSENPGGLQVDAPTRTRNADRTDPPKADPELLRELKQARELAQKQAELLQQQNDLIRQQANQEPPSATIGPSEIQRQQQIRR